MASGQSAGDQGARQEVLIGRERELAALAGFLDPSPGGLRALVLDGPAGIGKTSVWEAALCAAEQRGSQVLRTRSAPQESELDFLGLADLLRDLGPERLGALPPPRREALEGALLLSESEAPVDERAVFAGTLELLRSLSEEGSLVIGIDDWSWLDPATAGALAYAERRLRAVPVRFLLTERTPAPTTAPHLLKEVIEAERMTLGPLSFGAIGHLLHLRQSLSLSRPQARRLYELAAGNPMIALELSRAMSRRGGGTPSGSIPLTDRLRTLVAEGIEVLSAAVRRALLAVALSPAVTVAELTTLTDEDTLEEALRLEVLVSDGSRVRPVHPLLGEIVKDASRPSERRELHAALALATKDVERRAFHLAAAATGPDARLAAEIAAAAEHAAGRAAVATAVELAERALELTPDSDPVREPRLLEVGDLMIRAGQLKRAGALLGPEIPKMSPGARRGHARFLLTDAIAVDIVPGLEQALEDVDEPSVLRARILVMLAETLALGRCERLADAEGVATEALEIVERLGDAAAVIHASVTIPWIHCMRGLGVSAFIPRASEIPPDTPLRHSIARTGAVALMWSGHLDEARQALTALLAQADERGEGGSYFCFRLHLCELELRAGRWDAVQAMLEEWGREEGEVINHSAALLRFRALLAAGRGKAAEAATLAREALAAAGDAGGKWHYLESLRALGLAGLLSGDLESACASLEPVWKHTQTQEINNPGAFPVAADLVEALVLAGSARAGGEVAAELTRLAIAQDHPWAHAAGARARGHVARAGQDDQTALNCFAEAVERFSELGFQLDQARALTSLGATQRRLRRKREARESLESALAILRDLGSPGWAARAQLELDRVGGRVASGNTLTVTEQRVAELVAQGLANKQVASALVVTTGTVETHLTRIYAKLGVRSRAELVRALAPTTPQQSVGGSPLPAPG